MSSNLRGDLDQERRSTTWWQRRRPRDRTEELYLENRAVVERSARSACRRAGLPDDEADDFVSTVHLKLIDGDYAVLRRHRGESKLSTYLVTVVHNLFQDFQIRKLGKYRPSAKAQELGEEALQLERLLVRERQDVETALELMKVRHGSERTPDELRELAAQLPQRPPRRLVGEEALERRPAVGTAEDRLHDGDQSATVRRVEEVLAAAFEALSPQDLLILKMHFRDSTSIATIAESLHLEQRPLYTRKDRSLKRLRQALEDAGLTWDEVREILDWQGEIRLSFGGGVNPGTGTSNQVGEAPPREPEP